MLDGHIGNLIDTLAHLRFGVEALVAAMVRQLPASEGPARCVERR
jgi:hypothetical protein